LGVTDCGVIIQGFILEEKYGVLQLLQQHFAHLHARSALINLRAKRDTKDYLLPLFHVIVPAMDNKSILLFGSARFGCAQGELVLLRSR